jgi:hypothetical protein
VTFSEVEEEEGFWATGTMSLATGTGGEGRGGKGEEEGGEEGRGKVGTEDEMEMGGGKGDGTELAATQASGESAASSATAGEGEGGATGGAERVPAWLSGSIPASVFSMGVKEGWGNCSAHMGRRRGERGVEVDDVPVVMPAPVTIAVVVAVVVVVVVVTTVDFSVAGLGAFLCPLLVLVFFFPILLIFNGKHFPNAPVKCMRKGHDAGKEYQREIQAKPK